MALNDIGRGYDDLGPGFNPNDQPEWDVAALDLTSLKNLTQDEKVTLLQNCEYLHGVRVGRLEGPMRTTRPVARRIPGNPSCVREMNNIITEAITTKNEREANYVHQGWSLGAASALSPWTSSRIEKYNLPNPDQVRVTKRTFVQRLSFLLSIKELEPAPEFEAEIVAAMEKPTTVEKFQALYQALDVWGDMLPLEFDVGVSLTFTDSETNMKNLPDLSSYDSIAGLLATKIAHITKRGGDSSVFGSDDGKWLATTVPPVQWCQVRVVTAAPTTDLLGSRIKRQLLDLYSERVSHFPLFTAGPTKDCTLLDDYQRAAKRLSSVIIFGSGAIESITFNYLDGTKSNCHGSKGSQEGGMVFTLRDYEHIVEMMVWSDANRVYGVQFITNLGRVSPHYGGEDKGVLTAAKSNGGVLGGLSSVVRWDKNKKDFLLVQLEGMWCHDVLDHWLKEEDTFSDYFGFAGGTPFNDRALVRNSASMYISSLSIYARGAIDSIQINYVDNQNGKPIELKTVVHGVPSGPEKRFVLESGEHIISVTGKYGDDHITQLCFVTNTGRVSEVFGTGGGTSFMAAAPQDRDDKRRRLQYICGKSSNYLRGVMFGWTPF